MSIRNKQADRILTLLESCKHVADKWGKEAWCDLPHILALGIASHTRRISDLRKRGHVIECRKEWVDGQCRTKYRLVRPVVHP